MIVPKELVSQAKSKLSDKAAKIIAEELKLEKFDDKNLKACCPFHKEDTPSFVYNLKGNYYKCFGCSRTYSIIDHFMAQGLTYLGACEKLFSLANVKFSFGEKGLKTKREYRYPKHETNFDRSKVEEYLALRKISQSTLDYCDVQEDDGGNIVFNFYNENDVLMLVKYRPARKLAHGENKTWCQKNADTSPILINMNRIDPTQPLLITEGEIDLLSVIEAGFLNAVSIPFGAGNDHWIEENWEWLEQFEKIIIFSDNDEAGLKMRKSIIPRLGTWRCYYVDLPDELEKDGVMIKVKDANEVLYHFGKEKIMELIEGAKESPITNVVDLYDVEDFDIGQAEGVYSGIKELDSHIHKFFFGCLSIITGINGSGKSVWVNQTCICEPINQGYDCFVFSGELTKPQLRSWLEYNFAGRKNVTFKNHIRTIEPKAKQNIRDWYKGRIFLYDNDLDFSAESILGKMEELARKRGVRVFTIDNLMMVGLDCGAENIWIKQKEFIISLIRFARKYNVLVNLVCHPRKLEGIRRLTKMDVGGSGDITNLAHYVIAVHRVTPKEKEGVKDKFGGYKTLPNEFSCMIDLFKNRMTGTQDKDFGVYFDMPSYRLWSTPEELDKDYGWDKSFSKVKLPDPREERLPPFMRGE